MEPFIGIPKKLNKPITDEEVKKAIDKLNNNRVAGPDRIPAELIKYGPQEINTTIKDILNECIENHQRIDVGSGILVALQNLENLKGQSKTCDQ